MKSIAIALLLPLVAVGAIDSRQGSTSFGPECTEACTRLADTFNSGVHFPGNGKDFTVWDSKQQEVRSACRVQPSSTEEVSRILDIILDTSCRFAVKGGGHARSPDDSVSVGGVTIDLQRMRAVDVAPDRQTVRLGSGHVLGSMYAGLERYNLTTLGGRAASVGLGGYALGGGFSHLSPVYGLAMDNIFEYELVLPNVTIATVSENSNADLYFALRGGMNNFGIVTHFTMRAVEQGPLLSGEKTYTANKRNAIIDQAYKLTTKWKNDTAMAFYYSFGYNQSEDTYNLAVTEEYSRPILNPSPFEELDRIPSKSSTVRIGWLTEFSREVDSATPPGGRNMFATVTYSPSRELDRKIQDIMLEEARSVRGTPGFFPNLVIQPLYEGGISAGKARGGSAAGIEADGPLTTVLLTVLWDNAADDRRMYSFGNRWTERATAASKEAGKHNRWLYINYASKEQDPFAGYGEENVERLRSIQQNVDPQGVFTSTGLCRGYFKLV